MSPQNVVAGSDGFARLVDFGICDAGREATGWVKGKLDSMAPEQMYALGVVLWSCSRGRASSASPRGASRRPTRWRAAAPRAEREEAAAWVTRLAGERLATRARRIGRRR